MVIEVILWKRDGWIVLLQSINQLRALEGGHQELNSFVRSHVPMVEFACLLSPEVELFPLVFFLPIVAIHLRLDYCYCCSFFNGNYA